MIAKLLAIFVLATATLAAQADGLPPAVLKALKAAQIPAASVAVVVQPVDAAAPLVAHNAGQPMNPASVMKLVTTYAALDLLGPAYTWSTPVYIEGAVRDGTLYGTLTIRGLGDPKLVLERMWLLLRRVQGLGVRHIHGDIVLDHSAFSELTAPQLTHQFDAGEAAFVRAVGQRPFLVRPPYGRRDVDSDRVVVARHYTQVMWGITAADTSQTTARGVVDAFRSALRRRENGPRVRGGVVLLHDTKPWVIEAFPQLLAEVQARNCALLARGGNEELWDIAPDLTPFFEARQRGDHASMMTRNGGYAPAVQAARQAVLRAETARRCAGAVR